MGKIIIPNTDTTLIVDELNQKLEIQTPIHWTLFAEFKKEELEIRLDDSGEIFEPTYKLNLKARPNYFTELNSSTFAKEFNKEVSEVQKVFNFIEENKENLFEMLDLHGVIG
ncbi:hypothetical protein [Streptococcus uberis]|uniref:hypothetical protein n=1 Tax=Streptococcus uberis TaxID=1349 RepID=UPI0020BFB2C3|nr:hypothetical protein [Streptococcus uberis]